ncbi:MAG: DUF1080 domain-containing protein [Salinivirgaceae bacterium]|jgi:hypothetical protein|nr:DUF1080 domain-containing protein [Salinivirgaceae bacterium]
MKFISFLLLVFLMITVSCNFRKSSTETIVDSQWVSLFNGKDLTGWTSKISGYELGENYANTFRVDNGILSIRYDQYDNFSNEFGALYYNKQFSNYRLRVEYRFVGDTVPGAPKWGFRDSGIQYHGQDPKTIGVKQAFPVCLEYNLHGGNGSDERPVGEICANGISVVIDGKKTEAYSTSPKVAHTFHGDQWVTAEIECKNGEFKHFVNGEEIMEYTNPQFKANHELGKLFYNQQNNAVSKGYISLQSNSHPIDFRKIEIQEY